MDESKKYTFKYSESEEALYIGSARGTTVFKKGCLVRVYATSFSGTPPNDVNKEMYRDILIDTVESPLSTNYYICFWGTNIHNPNPSTNRGDFIISKKCDAMGYIELLKNNQLKLNFT